MSPEEGVLTLWWTIDREGCALVESHARSALLVLARGAAVVDDEDAAAPAAVCRVGTHCDDDGDSFLVLNV